MNVKVNKHIITLSKWEYDVPLLKALGYGKLELDKDFRLVKGPTEWLEDELFPIDSGSDELPE